MYITIHSYILTQFIASNKMAYPAMYEQYAVIMVPDFIIATQAMVNVVDHLYSGEQLTRPFETSVRHHQDHNNRLHVSIQLLKIILTTWFKCII